MGVKFTGEITLTSFPGPTDKEIEVLRAVVDEAKKVGVLVQVHAVSAQSTMAGVDAGVPLLVHTTNKNFKMMGPNTASYLQMGDILGELAPGKLADIVLLDGDPLEGYWNWLKAKVVIKGGRIVVDKR